MHFKSHARAFSLHFFIAFLVSEEDRSRFVCETKKKGSLPVFLQAGEVSVLAMMCFSCGAEGIF